MRHLIPLAILFSLTGSQAVPQEDKDDLKKKTAEMKKEMTKIRGLEFKQEVTVGVYSKKDLQKFIEGEFERELPRAKAKRYERAYAHLGLIPEDMDLYDSLIVLFSDSIAGFYHPKTKEMRLVNPDESGDEGGGAMGIDMQAITLVHELCHAAQDQNFNLITVPVEEETNDDMVYAIKALIEGEASAVGWKYGFKETFDQVIKMVNDSYKTGQLPGKAGKLPAYLKETLTFPYGYGCDFVLAVKKANDGDWTSISKMYEDLPSSTEQALHPEKYYDKRDNPTIISIPRMGKDWDLLTNNVHGEFVLRILLKELKAGGKREIEKAAAGWDGDRYHVYLHNDVVSSVWLSTWDTEDDAKEFYDAFVKGLGKKHKDAKEAEKTETKVRWATSTKAGVLVERRGSDILFIDGEEDLLKEAGNVWEKSKKEELKKVERFKQGVWTCQDHPKVEKDLNTYCPECSQRLTIEKKGEKKDGGKKDYR